MDSIKQWVMTVCFAALAAGLANIIAPKGNMEKVYKFAVSVFFLCCVLVPLFDLKGVSLHMNLASTPQQQNSTLQRTVQEQELSETKDSVSALITSTCQKSGVTPASVTVNAQISQSGVISIINAAVKLKKGDASKKSEIIPAVKQELGIDITVDEQ